MDLVSEARTLFANEPRPEHFTDHQHCDECAEHDETLRTVTPDTLTLEQVPYGWDPFCFVTPEAFRYYFPGLVRLAIEGTGDAYFIDRFLFHLEHDGSDNVRYQAFSHEQRAFVVKVLEHLMEHRAAEIDRNLDTDNLFRVLQVWA